MPNAFVIITPQFTAGILSSRGRSPRIEASDVRLCPLRSCMLQLRRPQNQRSNGCWSGNGRADGKCSPSHAVQLSEGAHATNQERRSRSDLVYIWEASAITREHRKAGRKVPLLAVAAPIDRRTMGRPRTDFEMRLMRFTDRR